MHAAGLTRRLAALLDAPAILGCYSRLLIDLNRPPDGRDAMPSLSENTPIPGNDAIDDQERRRRTALIFEPYHRAVQDWLDRTIATRGPPLLVSVHSFTPVFKGEYRPWHAGILFGEARELGLRVAQRLRVDGLAIGLNEPYGITAEDDYSIPVHGDGRSIPSLLLEIRNDGIATSESLEWWAQRLATALRPELAS